MIINNPGNMTKMSVYGKNIKYSSSQELLNLLQRNLTCSN